MIAVALLTGSVSGATQPPIPERATEIRYRMSTVASHSWGAGYLAGGGELQTELVGLRGEVRTYVACVESPVTHERHDRPNVTLALAVAYHIGGRGR